jgi:hypothetical protein
MSFDLPTTGNENRPSFADAAECREWLARIPLANVGQAQPILLRQLNLMHRYALPPTERFAILEVLRGPVCDVQEIAAKTFAGKPLPLVAAEQAALESTLETWRMLAHGYLRCFAALCDAATVEPSEQLALAAQRAISAFADWQVDLCRGEQLPDADYWKKLNQLFFAAETFGVATQEVKDPVRHGSARSSALAAFAECNLVSTASPYELPARHLTWVARWARRWGAKLNLLKAAPEDIRNRAVPLWVDLGSNRPATYVPQSSSDGRWLETTELRKSLLTRIGLLEQGRAPGDLQLGSDVTQPAAGQLLQRVLQRWCAGGEPRRHERHSASGGCNLVAGFEAAHFHLYGRQAFRAPARDDAALRREREEFETFGGRRHSQDAAEKKGALHVEDWRVMDDWRLLNESAAGLRIVRPLREGVRIGAGLLIAIKVEGSPRFTLASVRWALREGGDSLVAGIQLFPGEPRPAAIRILDPADKVPAWRQCFLLPEIPALREPASLVVPAGTFKLDRKVEVMVDQEPQVMKLFRVLDRGAEFERCNVYAHD